MSFINKINTATELQREFAEYNRDDYEMCTYEGIIEFMESMGEDIELDVIAWCCDLTEEHPQDTVSQYDELETLIDEHRASDLELLPFSEEHDLTSEELEIVVEFIQERTSIICSNSETITYITF
jgi:hypothetical protein